MTYSIQRLGLEAKLGSRATFSLIQFSGIKQLAKTYAAPGDGSAGTSGLKHYQVEVEKTALANAYRKVCTLTTLS